MIVSAFSRDNAILQNIVQTLQQMKQGAVPNNRLALEHTASSCTVSFYIDEGRTHLLFTENTTANAGSFSTEGTRTYYTPPDQKLNFAPTISSVFAQPFYYVTAAFSDSVTLSPVYRNIDNLVFQQVVVSSKDKPEFTTSDNTAIVVAKGFKQEIRQNNDTIQYVLPLYDIYVQLNVFNWAGLSELQRVSQGQVVDNLIRNALYADPTRGSNCTFWSKDLYGTNVDSLRLLPSDAMLKAVIRVHCAYQTAGTGN